MFLCDMCVHSKHLALWSIWNLRIKLWNDYVKLFGFALDQKELMNHMWNYTFQWIMPSFVKYHLFYRWPVDTKWAFWVNKNIFERRQHIRGPLSYMVFWDWINYFLKLLEEKKSPKKLHSKMIEQLFS